MRHGLGSRWWPGNRGNGVLARGLAAGLAAVSLSLLGTVPALGVTATPAGDLAVPLQDGGGHAARTVVTLTFDDGDADQMAAARVLHRYRLPATFYIITGAVGAPGYVTLSDLRQLAADGNEIGGHTVSHLRLTALSTDEARRQVCGSRSILARWGYRAVSFAYPGGADSPQTEAIVRGCGYTSARGLVGLRAPGCPGCVRTEGIPPPHPMALRTAGEVDSSWSLHDLERTVTAAEQQGGWLPLVFHHVCGGSHCGGLAVRLAMLDTFARWLASRQRLGTAVRTVGQVIGGPAARGAVRPTPHVAPAAPHGIVNPSLESDAASGAVSASLETTSAAPADTPRCWMEGGYGRNTVRWQRTTDSHAGRWAQRLTITSYHSGDAKLLPQFDLGQCSLPVRAGRSYTLSAWYQSTARTQYSAYYRTWSGRWVYWTSSPYFAASPHWSQARWATPPVPAGASGLSFGLALFSKGSLTTDSYRFAVTPPDVTRRIADWVLLAALCAAGLAVAARAVRRRRARANQG
ncbi:MAG: polysaccharide deacetylase family protein [Streptosporangiaceae bacterium]